MAGLNNTIKFNKLAVYIKERFDLAKSSKSEITNILNVCKKMYYGKSVADERANAGKARVDIVFDRASSLVEDIKNSIKAIFDKLQNNPFVFEATEIPDLPESLKEKIRQDVVEELKNIITNDQLNMEGISEEQLAYLIDKHNNQMEQYYNQEDKLYAKTKAENLTSKIEDIIEEIGFINILKKILSDFVIYPNCFLKYPSVIKVLNKEYDGNQLIVEEIYKDGVEIISPFNIYPSSDALDINNSSYIIELRSINRSSYINLLEIGQNNETIIASNIKKSLIEYSDGYSINDLNNNNNDTFDIIMFYGKIDGKILNNVGLLNKAGKFQDELALYKSYEAEIWVCGDYVIYLDFNNNNLINRPFYTTSFYSVNDSFWGISPLYKLKDTQSIITSASRALVRNLRLSTSFYGEVDISLLEDERAGLDINPFEIVSIRKIQGQGNAYNFHTFPDLSANIYNLITAMEDELYKGLNLNRAAMGNLEGISAASRSAVNLFAIMDRSLLIFKQAALKIDNDIIIPICNKIKDKFLLENKDTDLYDGDKNVRCLGIIGIVSRENAFNDTINIVKDMILTLYQLKDEQEQPLVDSNAVKRIFRTILKRFGVDVDVILPNFDEIDLLAGKPINVNSFAGYEDKLDGRSKVGKENIANFTNVT